jgi:hypothetical protein
MQGGGTGHGVRTEPEKCDFSHESPQFTFSNIPEETAAAVTISSQLSSQGRQYGQPGLAVWTVHHCTNNNHFHPSPPTQLAARHTWSVFYGLRPLWLGPRTPEALRSKNNHDPNLSPTLSASLSLSSLLGVESKENHGMGPYAGVDSNLSCMSTPETTPTWARVDLNPMLESTLSPSQGLWTWPLAATVYRLSPLICTSILRYDLVRVQCAVRNCLVGWSSAKQFFFFLVYMDSALCSLTL